MQVAVGDCEAQFAAPMWRLAISRTLTFIRSIPGSGFDAVYPFTAPNVSPRIRLRCTAMVNITTGSMMPIAPAAESDQ